MKKFLIPWMLSVVLFAVYFIGIFSFMNGFEIKKLVIYFVCLFIAVIMFLISNKKLTFPEGYTLIQAIVFYLKCKKNGIESPKDYDRNPETIDALYKNITWAEKLSAHDKRIAFSRGRAIIKNKTVMK